MAGRRSSRSSAGDAYVGMGEASRILDDLIEAMRLENCVWQPDIVAALTAESPVHDSPRGGSASAGTASPTAQRKRSRLTASAPTTM